MVNSNLIYNPETVNFLVNSFLQKFKNSEIKWPVLLSRELQNFGNKSKLEKVKNTVSAFRQGIREAPENFEGFLETYYKLFDHVHKNIPLEERSRFVLQDLGGLAILSDYDETGYMTCEMMFLGSEIFAPCYNYPKNYGDSMRTLSEYFETKGNQLTNLLFSKNPFN